MSYEMLRFGWQKLLVNQVPQKGGRRYAPVIQGPPPRDWSPEWNRVTAAGQSALKELDAIGSLFTTTGTTAQFVARQNEINAKIASATNQIDQALALNSTIPASWFGDRLAERNSAIASLQQTRSNLSRFIGNRTPTQLDLVSDEVDRQLLLLASQNRILKGPIAPLPPDGAYPSGSWQYVMWSKGYALHEISWVEEEMSRDPVILGAANDYELYKKLIEDKIQDGIVGGKIPPAVTKEILAVAPIVAYETGSEILLGNDPVVRTPTGPIGGIGTFVPGQPPVISQQVIVYGEDGKTYGSPGAVPKGIRWSNRPWIIVDSKPLPDGNATVGTGAYDAESGVGTNQGGPIQSYYDPVYGEDGVTYSNPMAVPLGIRWSRTPWAETSLRQEIRLPTPPRGVVPGTKAYQTWLRRQVRTPIKVTPGRPAVIYCDKPGWNTPPSINLPKPNLPIGQINSQPRCGTGIVTGREWEAVLIGEGCTIAHLDTIRRFFTTAKLAPRADQVAIARNMCVKLKNQDALIPNVGVVNPIDVGQRIGTNLLELDSSINEVANIPGVISTPVSPRTIAAQNLAARRQASRVRRGAFR